MCNPFVELLKSECEDDVEELEREQEWLEQGYSCRTLNPSSRDWVDEGTNVADYD